MSIGHYILKFVSAKYGQVGTHRRIDEKELDKTMSNGFYRGYSVGKLHGEMLKIRFFIIIDLGLVFRNCLSCI